MIRSNRVCGSASVGSVMAAMTYGCFPCAQVGDLRRLAGRGPVAQLDLRPGELGNKCGHQAHDLGLPPSWQRHRRRRPQRVVQEVQAPRPHPERLRWNVGQPRVPQVDRLCSGCEGDQVLDGIAAQGDVDVDLSRHRVRHQVEQVVAAGDVAVEGRLAGAQRPGHVARRHGRQVLTVRQFDGDSGQFRTAVHRCGTPFAAFRSRPDRHVFLRQVEHPLFLVRLVFFAPASL